MITRMVGVTAINKEDGGPDVVSDGGVAGVKNDDPRLPSTAGLSTRSSASVTSKYKKKFSCQNFIDHIFSPCYRQMMMMMFGCIHTQTLRHSQDIFFLTCYQIV